MAKFKWILGALGWVIGGPIGGIIGFLVGSGLEDKPGASGGASRAGWNNASGRSYSTGSYTTTEQRNSFMISLLVLSTAVMKADGKVLRSELEYVKQFIRNNFGQEAVADALQVIKGVLDKEINLPQVCAQIKIFMVSAQRLQLFHYLAGLAKADGIISVQERTLLLDIAKYLGLNVKDAESVLEMYGSKGADPYKILEIESTATDDEVKKAYRRMAIKFHPDKVESLGADVKKAAEEKFKNVQQAYEQIKKERGL